MWTYDNFPASRVAGSTASRPRRAGSTRRASPRPGSAAAARRASCRPDGLVMTNHHCAHACIEDLSTAQRDLVKSGFLARERADERRCPDMAVDQLRRITDVTERIRKATAGLEGGAVQRRAGGGPGGHRAGVPDQRRAPLRGGVALPRRRVQPVRVPPLPGRPAGVRAGVRHRLLRRRPGQLRVPALRPRRRLPPRVRGREAGPHAELLQVVGPRAPGRASSPSSRATPARPSGSSPWPSSPRSAT